MGIGSINPGSNLRLVHPAQGVEPLQPQQPVEAASRPQRSFDDIYETQQIKASPVPLVEAQRRLEKIRKIIAAQTQVPVHFDPPRPAAPSNPFAPSYLKFPTNHAELNATATDHAAGE